jgi:DNA-binding MarR family transcriptional regulator
MKLDDRAPESDAGALPADAPAASSSGSSDAGDHVDHVRDQWRFVRPELDTSPLAIVARVGRAAAYFDQSTNALMANYGLARSSWDVLASLRRAGPPYELSPTDLYRSLMRTSGAMTNRVQRLERAGLIERRPDSADGRSMLVRLTPDGLALVDQIVPLHLDNEDRVLAALAPEERAQLEDLLRRLLRGLEQASPEPPRPASRRRHRPGRR